MARLVRALALAAATEAGAQEDLSWISPPAPTLGGSPVDLALGIYRGTCERCAAGALGVFARRVLGPEEAARRTIEECFSIGVDALELVRQVCGTHKGQCQPGYAERSREELRWIARRQAAR